VATLEVKRSVCPLAAPVIVEYSPAYEQLDIVTAAPFGSIAAEPYDEVLVQVRVVGGGIDTVTRVVVRQLLCVPQVAFLLTWA
jgi:hypothetical protein